MHEPKLKKLHDKATPKKLAEMFDKANRIKEQAVRSIDESNIIVNNVALIVKKRLDEFDDTNEHLAIDQLFEMSKQWSIMSASIVKVKNSVKLFGFHSCLNLYINSKYGIKEYKRFTRYSPFSRFVFHLGMNERKPYEYQKEELIIMKNPWDNGILDFRILRQIPQLDQNRIDKFIEITKDIVYITDSWRNFYKVKDCSELKAFERMKEFTYSYAVNNKKECQADLFNLDKIIASKKKFSIDLIKQAARWELTIKKWKEVNKNFLVLNELRKSKLKI